MLVAITAVMATAAAIAHSDNDKNVLATAVPTGVRAVPEGYEQALASLDWGAVTKDLSALMTDSQDFWLADYGHYGPLLIRLAWHCAGSYRIFDGRGGCDGARLRFDPERSWEDNTNLDKARRLLEPIKVKHGLGLSWGDLIILAGTMAIKAMGGPVLGFCGGRVDDPDGYESRLLGPNAEQELFAPCPVNGRCESPFGASAKQLIYVDAQGVQGNGDPAQLAGEIRKVFSRMGMDDFETVALSAGGHTFGKTHGACPGGAGPTPAEDEENPWPGKCGTGKGADAFTSGMEGPWTNTPTKWSNTYLEWLAKFNFKKSKSPAGGIQYVRSDGEPVQAPAAHGEGKQPTMMLTSDIALTYDKKYLTVVKEWSQDITKLEDEFQHAWYKLVTRDMGPRSRCAGSDVPPPQHFQAFLPPPPSNPPAASNVQAEIEKILGAQPEAGGLLVGLAESCWASFRATDYSGGCNGARVRFAPQKNYPENRHVEAALAFLEPVKSQYGPALTWADLIILAGTTALERFGVRGLTFCSGRSDALGDEGHSPPKSPRPVLTRPITSEIVFFFTEYNERRGISPKETVALMGGLNSARAGKIVSNEYFKALLVAPAHSLSIEERIIRTEGVYRSIVLEYISDNQRFLTDFANAWTRRCNIDRFQGPVGNVCYPAKRTTTTASDQASKDEL